MSDFSKSGEFIAELRKAKGLKQSDLGELIGVGDKTISKWERGINVPDVLMLNSLAKIFDVSIEEILNGKRDDKLSPKIVKLYENKKIRYSVYALVTVVLIFSLILLLYFCNNYDKFKIYRISSRSDNYELTGNIYRGGKRYELVIDDFDVYDKEKYDDFEIYEYKIFINIEDKNILSLSRINMENNDNEKITFKELIKRINGLDTMITKFKFSDSKLNGFLKIELFGNDQTINLEYKFDCFLEYHNNKFFYKK